MNKKQYDLIDEIQLLIENNQNKCVISPIKTLGDGWSLYKFGGDHKELNLNQSLDRFQVIDYKKIKMKDDPNMEPLSKKRKYRSKKINIEHNERLRMIQNLMIQHLPIYRPNENEKL